MEHRCEYCGRTLYEGELCGCKLLAETAGSDYYHISIKKESVQKIRDGFTQAGARISESLSSNSSNAAKNVSNENITAGGDVCAVDGNFELNLNIVDSCIVPTEREVHIRQYKIAEMRTPFLKKAFGRLQVTNKRVIFRAAGKSFLGPIITEKEFAIEELSGIDIKSDYNFSFPILLISIFEIILMTLLFVLAAFFLTNASDTDYETMIAAQAIIYAFMGVFLFLISRSIRVIPASLLFTASFLFSSASVKSVLSPETIEDYLIYGSSTAHNSSPAIMGVLCFVLVIIAVIFTILSGFVDDLQIMIKIKGAHDAINVSRSMVKRDWTGFLIIKPWTDTNIAIQELGALITDIKQQGDNAIPKWNI